MKLVSEEEGIFFPMSGNGQKSNGGKKDDNIKITLTYSDPNDACCPFVLPSSEDTPSKVKPT